MMTFILLLLYIGIGGIGFCFAAPDLDLVDTLPLFGTPPSRQYSGYLDGSSGCNKRVNGNVCQIHYWFAAARGDNWESKPLVLWLNGGPGASSLVGMVQENGPLLINGTGGLMENPYAWNKVANFFVIESPVGVGFSYCEAQFDGKKKCANTDRYTASTARAALVDFFLKFPELRSNDFFISGESYAGVYIPTLTYELLQYNDQADSHFQINLKGIAVGDPCTDNTAQRESMDSLWYANKYGLVDDTVYDVLRSSCAVHLPNLLMQSYQPISEILKLVNTESDDCMMAMRKYLLSSSRGIAGHWDHKFVDRYSLFGPVTDSVDIAMELYFNRPDVKAALHVEATPNPKWTMHAVGQDYTKEYDACNHNTRGDEVSMLEFYRKIIPKLDIAWIYNGDTDPAVSYEGTRIAVKRIGFGEVDGGGYRPWFYNHTATSLQVLEEKMTMFGPDLLLEGTGAQFGGEVVNYEHNLAFLTVHGSGHMVPQFRPQAAFHIISKLIAYHDLSPLMPLNSTLSTMSNEEFNIQMNNWTARAKSAPYL